MLRLAYRYIQKFTAFVWLFVDEVKSFFNKQKIVSHTEQVSIIGIIRMRNESLVLKDTLDHMAQIVDGIILYDDVSTDNSVEIAESHHAVLHIIRGKKWLSNRVYEETHHRQILLDYAQRYNPKWVFYTDCDERFDTGIRDFLLSELSDGVDGIKIRLFDAYITESDSKPYVSDYSLYNFRDYFGPEYRDILMIWRNKDTVRFKGVDAREPRVSGNIITRFYCQHYGKAISNEQWEETCQYYINNFPEPYISKWSARVGKAVHKESDFGNTLYNWEDVKHKGIPLNK